jgi:UDP-2-acetamido-3-amino-2,3-dideoxy-glucuronate N-acetyltransferase
MAVFDDGETTRKLVIYEHHVDWVNRFPIARKAEGIEVPISQEEPLFTELQHFCEVVRDRGKPRTDGENGLAVLQILHACEESIKTKGRATAMKPATPKYFLHSTAVVDQPCDIGEGTYIWHFSHVMAGSKLGHRCNLGQNVHVASNVSIGNNVKIQNNVSIYTGVELEDDVFCGPSMVFTNVINPRSHVNRKDEYRRTLVKRGATLGANSTIICGVNIGEYAFVAAGAVVTHDVPSYALVMGVPAVQVGWICQCGLRLPSPVSKDTAFRKRISKRLPHHLDWKAGKSVACTACGSVYELNQEGVRQVPSSTSTSGEAPSRKQLVASA